MEVVKIIRDDGTFYAVKDTRTALMFIWCYVNRRAAEATARKLPSPKDRNDLENNWRDNIKSLVVSRRNALFQIYP